jgi:hypothetical protein
VTPVAGLGACAVSPGVVIPPAGVGDASLGSRFVLSDGVTVSDSVVCLATASLAVSGTVVVLTGAEEKGDGVGGVPARGLGCASGVLGATACLVDELGVWVDVLLAESRISCLPFPASPAAPTSGKFRPLLCTPCSQHRMDRAVRANDNMLIL